MDLMDYTKLNKDNNHQNFYRLIQPSSLIILFNSFFILCRVVFSDFGDPVPERSRRADEFLAAVWKLFQSAEGSKWQRNRIESSQHRHQRRLHKGAQFLRRFQNPRWFWKKFPAVHGTHQKWNGIWPNVSDCQSSSEKRILQLFFQVNFFIRNSLTRNSDFTVFN